ncbi:MAG: hypothetical protein IPK21_04220 [Haliscomenobacter sp.]|nr:hypothetical protein [Haliscomenobacter sp.]
MPHPGIVIGFAGEYFLEDQLFFSVLNRYSGDLSPGSSRKAEAHPPADCGKAREATFSIPGFPFYSANEIGVLADYFALKAKFFFNKVCYLEVLKRIEN